MRTVKRTQTPMLILHISSKEAEGLMVPKMAGRYR